MSVIMPLLLVVIVLTVYSRMAAYYAFVDEEARPVPTRGAKSHPGNDSWRSH